MIQRKLNWFHIMPMNPDILYNVENKEGKYKIKKGRPRKHISREISGKVNKKPKSMKKLHKNETKKEKNILEIIYLNIVIFDTNYISYLH